MVERFDLVQYEHFDQLDRAFNGDWVRYSDHEAELSALKKQVEELTAERDDARRYAVEARLRENQAEDRRVSESFARAKAEAEAAALREALIEARAVVDAVTGHNQPDRPWSRQVRDRIDAALASIRETSE